jgi:hypothetical protein
MEELTSLFAMTTELYDSLRLRFQARQPDEPVAETQMLLLFFECRRLLLKTTLEACRSIDYQGPLALRSLWTSHESELTNYIFVYLGNGECPTPLALGVTRDLVDNALAYFQQYVSFVIGGASPVAVPAAPELPDLPDAIPALIKEFNQTRDCTRGRLLCGADFSVLKNHAREMCQRFILKLRVAVASNVSAHTLPSEHELELQTCTQSSLLFFVAVTVGLEGWMLKQVPTHRAKIPSLQSLAATDLLEAFARVYIRRIILQFVSSEEIDDPNLGVPTVLVSLLTSEVYLAQRAKSRE